MQCHPLSTANSGIRATLSVALNSMCKDSETEVKVEEFAASLALNVNVEVEGDIAVPKLPLPQPDRVFDFSMFTLNAVTFVT